MKLLAYCARLTCAKVGASSGDSVLGSVFKIPVRKQFEVGAANTDKKKKKKQ